MRLLAFMVLMLVGLSLACASEKNSSMSIRDSPSVQIVASSSKLKVSVSITTGIVSVHDPRLPMCAGTTHPCRGIERLQIAVNGRPLFVPTSLFFDLADLRNGHVRFLGSDAILLLAGGDASVSYGVKIRFNKDRVLARTLYSAQTPDEPLQETIYHEVALD